MRRAQDQSAGNQSGAPPTQGTTGNVPDSAGNVPDSAGNVPGGTAGATSTSLHDQPGTPAETTHTETTRTQTTSYARGTAAQPSHRRAGPAPGGGGSSVGGAIAIVAGALAFLAGLSAVIKRSYYPTLTGYAYNWNVRGWGWVLLVLGALLFAAGVSALLGMAFGRIAGVALAVLTAVVGFLFLAYTPVWGVILVALSVLAIWGLLRDSDPQTSSNSM
jgi:hypothetical protein